MDPPRAKRARREAPTAHEIEEEYEEAPQPVAHSRYAHQLATELVSGSRADGGGAPAEYAVAGATGIPTCSSANCSRPDEGTGKCKAHKSKTCKMEGCEKGGQGASGLCRRHGGGSRCGEPDCTKSAVTGGKCIRHGGGKRCHEHECPRAAQGGTDYCVRHGGGRRCAAEDCGKMAQGSTDYCIRHGGGTRCAVPDCVRSAVLSDVCIRHGGGRRCMEPNCDKSAQGATTFCVRHGNVRPMEATV